jgi:cellobiose phosphorylase
MNLTPSHGHFDDSTHEYVITDRFTPRAWHNYLCNKNWMVNMTQFGTCAAFYQPSGEGYRMNLTEDSDGRGGPRHIYLRDEESRDWWTVTGAVGPGDFDKWECRVGANRQVMSSERKAIAAEWEVMVPREDIPAEVWTLTLANRSDAPRTMRVAPFMEMHLTGGSTLMDFIAVLAGHYVEDGNFILGENRCVKFPKYFNAFFACDQKPDLVTLNRESFYGPYGNAEKPRAMLEEPVHNPKAGTDWLGTSQHFVKTLAPGETWKLSFAIGMCHGEEEGRAHVGALLKPGFIDSVRADLAKYAAELSEHWVVDTPDADFNRWPNFWLKHQLEFVGRWGRVIGRGFRDVLQDTFALSQSNPALARSCLKEVFSKQYASGRCIRAWRLPNGQLDVQHYADSPCWMIMALTRYLKETGDMVLLGEPVAWLPDEKNPEPGEASMWEHVLRAQRHLLEDRGQYGLVRIRYGDWCDTMNGVGAGGEGVSVMLSMQVKYGCDLFAELADVLGKADIAAEMRTASKELCDTIQANCWDGEWFIRAFDDEGRKVGSKDTQPEDNGCGKIFLNPQSWAMMAGISTPEQEKKMIAAVGKYLDTGYGCILHSPPFEKLVPRIGQMTAMTAGFYENGSVYVHGNGFWMLALAQAGYADEALRAWKAVLPVVSNKPNLDSEPYVVPNYYIGPAGGERAQRNLFLSGWRTGSAAWMWMALWEGLLGFESGYEALTVTPRLPSDWDHVRVTRTWRGEPLTVDLRRGGDAPASALLPAGQGGEVALSV